MYKCNECGTEVKSSSNIPIEHGKMSLAIYPDRAKSKKCNGKFDEVTERLSTSHNKNTPK